MIYFLLGLSTFVMFLAAVVFGISAVNTIKKDLSLGLGFAATFLYSALSLAIQVNGFIECDGQDLITYCVQYPEVNQIPLTRIGFDLISTEMRFFLMNLFAVALVFFLISFLKRRGFKFKK